MNRLVLLRHGHSRWNLSNKFSGWADIPLSDKGIKEAQDAAKKLKGINFDIAFTSDLERAHQTLTIVLAQQKRTGIFHHKGEKKYYWPFDDHIADPEEVPIHPHKEINERHYGDLTGLHKDAAREKYGEEQVYLWRRSFTVRPPKGESLEDVYKRVVPFFQKVVMPYIRKKHNVIISAHGNTLRALMMYLEGIEAEAVPRLELPPGVPLIYEYQRKKLKRVTNHLTFDRPLRWK
jgi:2,3-bisphosphoglycerate-dependent phosphoglycerate mutase